LPTGQGTTISTWVDGGLINKEKPKKKEGEIIPPLFLRQVCAFIVLG
jgi:hypothetical protein